MKKIKFFLIIFISIFLTKTSFSAEAIKPMKVDWTFKGLTGKFDRASLQKVLLYKGVCSSCHSMKYLSYRNLGLGGPFTEAEVKAMAAGFEITDGLTAKVKCLQDQGDPLISFKSLS